MRYLFSTLIIALFAQPLGAQGAPLRVAVLPFADGGSFGQDKANFDALQSALAALLDAELGANPRLAMTDRVATERELEALKLGSRGRIDVATAARIGAALGAGYVISGAFTDHYGRFGMDARIVNVGSGTIVAVAVPDASLRDRRDVSRMLTSITTKIEQALEVSVPRAAAPPVSTDAVTELGLGLDAERRGERARAIEWYQRAAAHVPSPPVARARLAALQNQ